MATQSWTPLKSIENGSTFWLCRRASWSSSGKEYRRKKRGKRSPPSFAQSIPTGRISTLSPVKSCESTKSLNNPVLWLAWRAGNSRIGLFLRGRGAARGNPNHVVVGLVFFQNAEPLRDFPSRLEFVELGRAGPNLRVCLGVVDDDLQLQRVMVDPPVTLREMQLLAARVSPRVRPKPVVEADCVDNERVPLPMADRIPKPARVGILR